MHIHHHALLVIGISTKSLVELFVPLKINLIPPLHFLQSIGLLVQVSQPLLLGNQILITHG